MDDALIERVARAICVNLGFDPDEMVMVGMDAAMTEAEMKGRHTTYDALWSEPRWALKRRIAAEAIAVRLALDAELPPNEKPATA